ncbi:YidC/Oxa1 family insertase periplasmic-domain containing protein [Lentisphaera profundi]|uniref:Membrane protein insertase YidC n=1 Tax=Lentisphaera profundi TaxID=1658616 RepID=A0ABY7VXB9_9BACT|nr:YidC/Oxa1 family insertase periplasmic-domain containing protein [Lentisphaera profundi]WDE98434.1 YidC/Oxa1 family insertase periplasmic-domain containing protein [Lentisphaera profundi]
MDKKGIAWLVALGLSLFLILNTENEEINKNIFGVEAQAKVVQEESVDSPVGEDQVSTPQDEPSKLSETTIVVPQGEVLKATAQTTVAEIQTDLPLHTLTVGENFSLNIRPGQGLKNAQLNEYYTTSDKTEKVNIGDSNTPSFNFAGIAEKWQLITVRIKEKTANALITESDYTYEGQTFAVQSSWKLEEDYHFALSHKLINTSDKSLNISGLYLNCGYIQPIQMGKHGFFTQQAIGNDQAVDTILKVDRKLETHLKQNIQDDIKDSIEDAAEEGRVLKDPYSVYIPEDADSYDWVAVKNQYFAFIADISDSFASVRTKTKEILSPTINKDGSQDKYDLIFAEGQIADFELAPGASKDISLDIFAGPQEIHILEKLGNDKKGIMQLNMFMNMKVSWLGFLSEMILKALFFFNGYVNSFGLSIILLTISVKLLFWRLTNKSNKSMKKMAILGPRIKEIREELKDNPQVMNQKVMALYREEGVNPAGGCLPMLLQMPIFISLFNALRSAIELRHVEFLWITDLSQPDTLGFIPGVPIRPLVIAWALLMLVQQRMTPSSADETQKKVMMFMPVMMLFFCYGMPAGLTLYWCFQSLMTLIQYKLNNRTTVGTPAPATAAK